jgi:hypothetical protein
MNRANVTKVTLTWYCVAPRTISLKAQAKQQSDGVVKNPALTDGEASGHAQLRTLFRRWADQIAAGVPITADLTADGKGFE